MRLVLSSAAAPDATLDELFAACVRRGLSGLELREQDAHGVSDLPGGVGGAEAQVRARAAGVEITGFYSTAGGEALALARVAAAAGAPVLVDGSRCVPSRAERAAALASVGAEVALTLEGDFPSNELEEALSCGCQVAWDVHVAAGNAGSAVAGILEHAGGRLRHIRLRGAGPEAAMHEGKGVGELMGRLALAGYAGSVVLAPSSTRFRVAWQNWLGQRGGWGCGGKQEDPTLVSLDRAVAAGDAR